MFNPKLEVLRLFLAFVTGYVAKSRAKLATLGGEGLEAMLWEKEGINRLHGWLIERNVNKGRHLVARYRYRYCSQLDKFTAAVNSARGRRYGIDGFHLDNCGTLEAMANEFLPVIPVFLRSRGKCLAITVADQRRNSSQENFEDIRHRAEKFYGNSALTEGFFSKFFGDYQALPGIGIGLTADPEIGAMREFGFAFHLLKAVDQQTIAKIDRIERYLYVSTGKERPFRMRTYFFHFGRRGSKQFVEEAMRLWLQAPLQCVTDKGLIPIHSTTKEVPPMAYQNLKKLAEAAGRERLDEFNHLIADAEYGRAVMAIKHGSIIQPSEPAKEPATEVRPNKNGESLRVQIDMLRAAAKGPEFLKTSKGRAIKRLGLKGKGKNRCIGAYYARTQGKFRSKFMKALAVHGMLDDTLLQELAAIYTAITKKEVTTEQLKQES